MLSVHIATILQYIVDISFNSMKKFVDAFFARILRRLFLVFIINY